jgi:pyridinium-3,5-biscarboxylic acid mononucleotide synthase
MNRSEDRLKEQLRRFQSGDLDETQILAEIQGYQDLGFAKLDHDRWRRCGFPEVIFGEGKEPADLVRIFEALSSRSDCVLATRAGAAHVEAVQKHFPEARYEERARCLWIDRRPKQEGVGLIGLLAAGTSDLPVAEEARITAELMGAKVSTHYDVGVAGLHRLLDQYEALRQARVLIVVAGMEGALPSVVGGLVDRPVLAVPTSVGYGAAFGGIAALLGMLNSCAPGVSVLNIDNGFGAGHLAALINRLGESDLES